MSLTVKFNGTDLTKLFTIGGVSRPLPEFRGVSTAVDGRDGEVFDGMTLGPREVAFDVVCRDKDLSALHDAARQLMSILAVRSPKALTFSDEKDADKTQLVRYAVPFGNFDTESFIKAARWTCRFKQPDPYLYGKKRTAVIPANDVLNVDTGGNADAWLKAEATVGNGSYYMLRIVKSYWVKYSAPFSGQTIAIDMDAQTAKLDTDISGADGLVYGTRFFPIRGMVKLTATHRTQLSWQERWL